MRNKVPQENKKITISVSLHYKLAELLKNYSKENNMNRSKVIQNLLDEFLKNNEKI